MICSSTSSCARSRADAATSTSKCCRAASTSGSASTACLRDPDFGLTQPALDRSAREIVSRIKILSKLDISERRRPQDGSFQVSVDRDGAKASIDLRVSVIPSYSGESVVIRILDRAARPRASSR